jgi:hypothetical protein
MRRADARQPPSTESKAMVVQDAPGTAAQA